MEMIVKLRINLIPLKKWMATSVFLKGTQYTLKY